jgi:death-on-curing protein
VTGRREPRWLLEEAVVAFHHMVVAQHGGASGIRDRGLLSSALARPRNLSGYADRRPSLAELAAAYAFGIVRNHPFVDGNKRVGLIAGAVFLEINGRTLDAPEAETVAIFTGLAAGTVGEEELAAWLEEHSKKRH